MSADERRADWTGPFLAALASCPNVTAAARAAGITRKAAYDRRKADEDFAAAWQDALDQSTDALVGEMYRRAVEGTEEPVFYMGGECGRIRRYSDRLAMFLAKAFRRDQFGDKLDQRITGADGGAVQIQFYLPDNGRGDNSGNGDPPASGPPRNVPGDVG